MNASDVRKEMKLSLNSESSEILKLIECKGMVEIGLKLYISRFLESRVYY